MQRSQTIASNFKKTVSCSGAPLLHRGRRTQPRHSDGSRREHALVGVGCRRSRQGNLDGEKIVTRGFVVSSMRSVAERKGLGLPAAAKADPFFTFGALAEQVLDVRHCELHACTTTHGSRHQPQSVQSSLATVYCYVVRAQARVERARSGRASPRLARASPAPGALHWPRTLFTTTPLSFSMVVLIWPPCGAGSTQRASRTPATRPTASSGRVTSIENRLRCGHETSFATSASNP